MKLRNEAGAREYLSRSGVIHKVLVATLDWIGGAGGQTRICVPPLLLGHINSGGNALPWWQ